MIICLLLLSACSSHKKNGPKAPVWLSFSSEIKAISSLPFRIKYAQFIGDQGIYTVDLGHKNLDFGYSDTQFIDAIAVPVGEYSKLRLKIQFKESGLQVLEDQALIGLQMLDHDQLFVPETRNEFYIEQDVRFTISRNQRHFLQLNALDASLTLANTETTENYVLVDPQFEISMLDSLALPAKLIVKTPTYMTFNTGQTNFSQSIDSIEQALLDKPIGELLWVSIDKHSVTLTSTPFPFVSGIVAADGTSAWLFKVSQQSGVQFLGQKTLPSTAGIIAGQQILLPLSDLEPQTPSDAGQRLNGPEEIADRLQVKASDIQVWVNGEGEVIPLTLNGFAVDSFYRDSLVIQADWPDNLPANSFWQLSGWFVDQPSSLVFAVEAFTPIDSRQVTLRMQFHLFNETMLLHERTADNHTRLVFLDGLDNVTQRLHIDTVPADIVGSIGDMRLSEETQMILNTIDGDIQHSRLMPSFAALETELQAQLNSHKFFRLEGTGKLEGSSLILDRLRISLQSKNLINEMQVPVANDIVGSMADLTDITKASIDAGKDRLGTLDAEEIEAEKALNAVARKNMETLLGLESETVLQGKVINNAHHAILQGKDKPVAWWKRLLIPFAFFTAGISDETAKIFNTYNYQEGSSYVSSQSFHKYNNILLYPVNPLLDEENSYISLVIDFSDNFFESPSLSFDKTLYEASKKFKLETIKGQYSGVNFKYFDDISAITNNNKRVLFSRPLSEFIIDANLEVFKSSFDDLLNATELQRIENIIFIKGGLLIDAQSGQQLPFVYSDDDLRFNRIDDVSPEVDWLYTFYEYQTLSNDYLLNTDRLNYFGVNNVSISVAQLKGGNEDSLSVLYQASIKNRDDSENTLFIRAEKEDFGTVEKIVAETISFYNSEQKRKKIPLMAGDISKNGGVFLQSIIVDEGNEGGKVWTISLLSNNIYEGIEDFKHQSYLMKPRVIGGVTFRSISDQDIALFSNRIFQFSDYFQTETASFNPNRGENLRIIVQLEPDPTLQKAIYRRYFRDPEHSILIQVSFNKEYEIVNGLNNIEKFSLDQYKNNIVFDLQGHGNELLFSARNAASLSDTVAHIIKTLPEKMVQIHNALDGVEIITSNQVNVVPFLVDMGACLQGRRSPFFYDDIVNEGDKIRAVFKLRGYEGVNFKTEISNSIDINLLKQQSKTFTQKFMENLSRSLSDVNADALTRPVIFEAYDDSLTANKFGDDLPTELEIESHKVYMLDKGLVIEIDPEDIEYRFTRSTDFPDLFSSHHMMAAWEGKGFFEYRITNPILINRLSPNNQENFKGFRKVFRGKPEINPFASE